MITTCQFLGIHTGEIESAAKTCEDSMENLGFTMDEIDDMNDYARQELEEIGSWSDITNSIIGCYFRATEYMIHQKFPKLRVDYDVNGFCSRFDVDELPAPMTEEEIRADWEKALDTMSYGAISRTIEWGFCTDDLWKLMQLHQADKHREKIEDLLTDCNFHTFCSCLSDGDYSGAEKEIREMEEED